MRRFAIFALVAVALCSSPLRAEPIDDLARKSLPALKTLVEALEEFIAARQPKPPEPPPPPTPVPPTIGLSVDLPEISEAGGKAKVTATLSKVWTADVVATLVFSGDATADDFSASGTSITIPAGSQSGSITITVVDDEAVEENESLTVEISAATNVERIALPTATITITSDDVAPPPPPPPTPPTDPSPGTTPAFPEVLASHPRLYWHSDVRARIEAAPATLKYVAQIADTDATTRLTDTPVCCAALWLLSKEGGLPALPKGSKYLFTAEQYRDRGISKALVLAETQINLAGNHYATNHLHPLAILYDWLWNDMTEAQRAKIRATLVESLNAAYTKQRVDSAGKPVPVQNPCLYWEGYNAHSGNGMTVALAVHGETEVNWVRRYWDENWWAIPPPAAKGKGGFYNRQFERDWMVGAGNDEDWGYLGNNITIAAARKAWETATGDFASLNYPWLNDVPRLMLHEGFSVPILSATGAETGRRLFALPSCCSGGGYTGQGIAFWFAAGTGSRDATTAALSAWMLTQCAYSGQPATDELFWRVLVGDPRVKPKSPAELGLPFDFTTPSTGFHFDRTGWESDATRVFFGCSEQLYRATACGDVMIWSRGLPLIAHRNATFDHSYSGNGRLTLPQMRDVKTGKLIPALSGNGTPNRIKVASLIQVGDTFTADLSKLFPGTATQFVRSFRFDRAANVVTVIDEAVCLPGYVPTATWATPEKPVICDSCVVFSNGLASGVMTWDEPPEEVTFRGGETDSLWAEDYDRSLYSVEKTANWRKLSRADQIFFGGYYTVYVTPRKTGDRYRMVTTIKVN